MMFQKLLTLTILLINQVNLAHTGDGRGSPEAVFSIVCWTSMQLNMMNTVYLAVC